MTYSELHINRQERHEFWTEKYRSDRRRQGRMALLCFLLVVAIIMGLGLALDKQAPEPTFDGRNWNCPAGFSVYADEQELRSGEPAWVHCVK